MAEIAVHCLQRVKARTLESSHWCFLGPSKNIRAPVFVTQISSLQDQYNENFRNCFGAFNVSRHLGGQSCKIYQSR